MHDSKTHNLTTQYGYLIGVLGVSLILIWLGIYKFTPTEAKLIEPLVLRIYPKRDLFQTMRPQAKCSMAS